MVDLNRLIDDRAPAQELMMVVLGQIHPNLQLAYSLKLKEVESLWINRGS